MVAFEDLRKDPPWVAATFQRGPPFSVVNMSNNGSSVQSACGLCWMPLEGGLETELPGWLSACSSALGHFFQLPCLLSS